MPNNDIQTYNHPHGQVLINEQTLTDIADAIREQRLTDDTFKPAQFAREIIGINEIEGGEYEGEIDLSVEEKDINFYDYDGTRLYSYEKEEFLGLSNLPANPSHDNLIAQGWNWSLSDAKEYVQNYGILDVGQMYNTDNGMLEIDIELKENNLSPVLNFIPTYNSSSSALIKIDWGDNSDIENLDNFTMNNTLSISHIYNQAKKYTIRIRTHSSSSKIKLIGTSSGSSLLTGGGTYDQIYRNCITAVRVGSCVQELNDYAFKNCYSLKTITLHKDLFGISNNVFTDCNSLKTIIIPNLITNISSFQFCVSLQKIIIPNTIIYINQNNFKDCFSLKQLITPVPVNTYGYGFTIGDYAFKNCYSLKKIIISNIVLHFGNYCFQNCYSLKTINCYPITPPTVTSTTFTGLPTYTKIYVPWSRDHSILQAYKTATYWSDIADQIYQMSMNENIQIYEAYAEFDSSTGSLTFFRDLPNRYSNNQKSDNFSGQLQITFIEENTDAYRVKLKNTGNSSITSLSVFITDEGDLNNNDNTTITLTAGQTWSSSYIYTDDDDTFLLKIKQSTSTEWIEITQCVDVTLGAKIYYTGIETDTYDLSSLPWYTNRGSVTSVTFEDEIRPVSTAYWFYMMGNSSFTSITRLDKLDTSNVTNMRHMFNQCYSLTSLDLSSFDTSNVMNMKGMFSGCTALISLDLSSFDTSNVTNMIDMFSGCSSLTTIYVSDSWDVSGVTSSTNMFIACTNLVGGQGTTFNSSYKDKTRAIIDGGSSSPGYLTYKAATGGAS